VLIILRVRPLLHKVTASIKKRGANAPLYRYQDRQDINRHLKLFTPLFAPHESPFEDSLSSVRCLAFGSKIPTQCRTRLEL